MPEGGDAMADGDRLSMLMSFLGVLESLPGVFLSRQVILLPVLLGNTMRMGGLVV